MYDEIEAAGGLGKPVRKRKEPKGLRAKKPLKTKSKIKSKNKPIPKEVKEAVLEEKGRLCFLGHCPKCGAAPVGIGDDFHHFVHRAHGGKDEVDYLWPCRRECHSYIHDNPLIERMMFKEIEEAGFKVIWKAPTKGIGNKEIA